MFCKNCGRQLDEGESYCPICGTVNSPEAPVSPDNPFYGEPDDQLKNDMAGKTLTWGILSLAFGVLEGRAKTGQILGRIGFAIGLCYLAFMTLFAAAMVYMGICGAFV